MLLLTPSVSGLFKWRQFEPEVILLAVGWYLRFSLSYREVEELLAERGLSVDHVTVWRWVQRYAPEIQRRLRTRLRPTNDSWRVDETYIRVKGKWVYLYRAVDSTGTFGSTTKLQHIQVKELVKYHLGWKLALNLKLSQGGFHATTLV
jgi:IS6 family transposase